MWSMSVILFQMFEFTPLEGASFCEGPKAGHYFIYTDVSCFPDSSSRIHHNEK